MSIEEKAKAYDEALKWMRELYPGLHGATKEDAEHYFPELRDSEDERIRKAIESIIRVYRKTQGEWIAGYDMDTLVVHLRGAFACLEKQKEPILTSIWKDTKNEIAPAKRDILGWYRKADGKLEGRPYIVWFCSEDESSKEATPSVNGTSLAYWAELPNEDFKKTFWYDEQKEQKPLSTEETELNSIAFLEQLGYTCVPPGNEQKPVEWSEEDETIIEGACSALEIYGHTKLASRLKSLRPQPKQE